MHKDISSKLYPPDQILIDDKIDLVCVVFLFKDFKQILLQHRDNNSHINHPNIWGPPGGHCEIDEKPFECAKRELREETGYKVKDLYFYSAASYPLRNDRPHIVLNFWGNYDHKQDIKCYEGQSMEFLQITNLNTIKIFSYNINLINEISNEAKNIISK